MDARENLESQLAGLATSCREYDSGKREAISRIAGQLRTIFHDRPDHPSLLTQLKSHYIDLLSTIGKPPADLRGGGWSGLIAWELDPAQSMFVSRPKLEIQKQMNRFVAAKFWWDGEAAYQVADKKLKRRDLVLAVANQAGDAKLPPAYQAIATSPAWSVTFRPDPTKSERNIMLAHAFQAALRQIAHEAINSPALQKLAAK